MKKPSAAGTVDLDVELRGRLGAALAWPIDDMTRAAVIEAILANDVPTLRDALGRFARCNYEPLKSNALWIALLSEACFALMDDVGSMPEQTCLDIGVPVGTTYARGAENLRSQVSKSKSWR